MAYSLTETETKVLKALTSSNLSLEELSSRCGVPRDSVASALETLSKKGLVVKTEKTMYEAALTQRGLGMDSLPEDRLVQILGKGAGIEEARRMSGLSTEDFNAAVAWGMKRGLIKIENRIMVPGSGDNSLSIEFAALKSGGRKLYAQPFSEILDLKARKIIDLKEVKSVTARLAEGVDPDALVLTKAVSALTHQIMTAPGAESVELPAYALSFPSKSVPVRGKLHFYNEFLSFVRETLVSMGFEEMMGPYVEQEFWNFDALFVPQNHVAREEHDSYSVKDGFTLGPAFSEELAHSVGATHKYGLGRWAKGWGYEWSSSVAAKLVLRSHTTSVSVRRLAEKPTPPFKYFTIDRNFRRDAIDQTHLPDFDQCEGIVGARNLTFRNLLGFLEAFAKALGVNKIRFKPSFFPFTEPSVEAYIYHEDLGWIEAAPGGIFRPEVTRPLGIDFPVLAWGIGIPRFAMVSYGLDDLRSLVSSDLDELLAKEEALAKFANV
ncbi:MAG: phenylalanine--tRNA ligase subunit alpha [Thermoprotei archaeon]